MYYISMYLSAMLGLVAATSNDSTTSISNNLQKNTNIRDLRGEDDTVALFHKKNVKLKVKRWGSSTFILESIQPRDAIPKVPMLSSL